MTLIAVELPPTQAPAELRSALLQACTVAAAPDLCVSSADTGDAPEVFVLVSWEGTQAVHIELGSRSSDRWVERRLTFAEKDPELERWQAAGYVIGTLACAERQQAAATATAERGSKHEEGKPAAPAVTSAPTPTVQRKPPKRAGHAGVEAVHLEARATFTSGFDGGLRSGGGIALGARLAHGPFLLADAAVLFAESRTPPPLVLETVHGRFWALGLLPGMSWQVLPTGRVEAGLGPSLEYFWVWAGDRPGAARFVGGLKGAIGYRQKLLDRLTLSVAGAIGARFGETTVLVGGAATASLPLFFGGVTLGLAVDLWRRAP